MRMNYKFYGDGPNRRRGLLLRKRPLAFTLTCDHGWGMNCLMSFICVHLADGCSLSKIDPIMKIKLPSIFVALTLLVCVTSVFAEKSDPRADKARLLYHQGEVAMKNGRVQQAEASFRGVLKLYPTHPQARKKLNEITTNKGAIETNNRKSKLNHVVIPKVDMEKLTLGESLEVLSAHIKQSSPDKAVPNFIVQDRTGAFKGRLVTLNLSRVPAGTLLKYILGQVGGVARFDAHAVIIKPRQKTGS